jgi:hypothetical protein
MRLRPQAFLFQRRRDGVDAAWKFEAVELARFTVHAVLGEGILPRADRHSEYAPGSRRGSTMHDWPVVLKRELIVALVVRRNAHDRASP